MADQARSSVPSNTPPEHPRLSLRLSDANVFSDDFALGPLELTGSNSSASAAVAEGDDVASISPVSADLPRRSQSTQSALESPTRSLRRNIGSQRSNARSSLSSRADDYSSQASNLLRSVASVSDLENSALTPHQSVRTISTFGFPRSQSPYQGPSGPSHPYRMYPQDTGITRSPSMATTSTIRQPERSYSGPSGPTQPYRMYAQNTVPEDDQGSIGGLGRPIAAGFPGAGQDYQRRLGPDGEDADDLIGPDGYTEQLPAYTRYPNGIPPKYNSDVAHLAIDERPIQQRDSQAQQDSSQETLNSPQTREHTNDVDPFRDSSTQLNSTSVLPKDEGGNFKERIRAKSKKKVCCGILPCWAVFVLILALILATFLGGLVGGFLAHKHGEGKDHQQAIQSISSASSSSAAAAQLTATVTVPADASLMTTTPPNLPPLPTGLWSLALSKPSITDNTCLLNTAQSCAWDCATGANLSLNITIVSQNIPMVSLSYPTSPKAPIRYGAQPPVLNHPAPLMIVNDRDDPSKGPAYMFQQIVDKVVIVKTQDLPGAFPDTQRSFMKRWFGEDDGVEDPITLRERGGDSEWTDNSIAGPTDKPWYCFWNNTILEGFIYITNDTGTNGSTTGAAATSSISGSWQPGTGGVISSPSTTTMVQIKRQAPSVTGQGPYPKIVKIEERRVSLNNVQPYCQQMQILNTNVPGLLTNTAGQNNTIQLTEAQPPTQHGTGYSNDSPPGKRRLLADRGAMVNPCECKWLNS